MSDNPLGFLDDELGQHKPVQPPPLPDSLPGSFATKRPAWHSPPLWIAMAVGILIGAALTIVVFTQLSGQSATRDASKKVAEPQRHGEEVQGLATTPSQASEPFSQLGPEQELCRQIVYQLEGSNRVRFKQIGTPKREEQGDLHGGKLKGSDGQPVYRTFVEIWWEVEHGTSGWTQKQAMFSLEDKVWLSTKYSANHQEIPGSGAFIWVNK